MTELKMIKDLNVNGSAKIVLLLKDFMIKTTGAGKPYLWAIFTDGKEDIQAQDWDWEKNPSLATGQKFDKGLVYEIAAQVTEYQGKKQLKLARMSLSDIDALNFAPQGNVDLALYEQKLEDLILYVREAGPTQLATLLEQIIDDNYELFKVIPAALGMHHAYIHGLLVHSTDVAEIAYVIANATPNANVPLCVAGAIVHDLGKLRTYRLNGAIIEMTEEGQLIEHIMLGALMLDKYRTEENTTTVDQLLHIISSHHGKREYGSPTPPRTLEAMIVSAADGINASTNTVLEVIGKTPEDQEWTEKIWSQGNLPFLTPQAVSKRIV
ncbi:3'-5' exoribonuclease YhaM [compost metagenome]